MQVKSIIYIIDKKIFLLHIIDIKSIPLKVNDFEKYAFFFELQYVLI